VGWNRVEIEGLGESFENRGKRFEEQVEVMRALWATENVKFDGAYHHIDRAGIAPRPPGGRIPIWLGGRAEVVLRRAARIADGFMPQFLSPDQAAAFMDTLEGLLSEAGRSMDEFGVDASAKANPDAMDHALALAGAWKSAGATHLTVNTIGTGCVTVDDHLSRLRTFRDRWTG
jgi:alkanesulfonate monooxygenase SsuD/methylene tetrahydromethanopterin reductase-like flavin-dependent oxidoreductase (luciferase family)